MPASTFGELLRPKPVQGPGLGWNQDYLWQNQAGQFQGVYGTPQPGRTYPGQQGSVLGASTGGGGGSLGGTQTQDWDRMWREAGNTGIRPEGYHGPADTSGEDLARQQAQLELEQALTEYDRYTGEAEAQKGALGTQRTQTLSELETGYGRAEKQALASKEESTSATLSAKNKALTTAQDIQRKNRNVLRALGILSSSAAGEMLNRPMEEYGTQAGTLETNLIKRKDQVNDWLAERLQDFNTAKINLNDQFTQLMDNINRDLRFNDRQRITAVKAAQVAAQNAVQTLKQQAMAYQQAAQQYNANILTQIAQIKLTQNPQADVSGILSTMINPSQQSNYKSPTTSIYQTEEQRRRLSGLGV